MTGSITMGKNNSNTKREWAAIWGVSLNWARTKLRDLVNKGQMEMVRKNHHEVYYHFKSPDHYDNKDIRRLRPNKRSS